MDANGFDRIDLKNGSGEFAFESAAVIEFLNEVGDAETALVKQFPTCSMITRQFRSSEFEAGFVNFIGMNENPAAFLIEFVGYMFFLKHLNDLAGIFKRKFCKKRLVL